MGQVGDAGVIEWRDEGIVLSSRPLGERDAVASILTFSHGRHAGLVRGGVGKRQAPLLQPGNRLQLTWTARLEQHLGVFVIEPERLYAGRIMADPLALLGLAAATSLIELGCGERDPHPRLYAGLLKLVEALAPASRPRHEAAAGSGRDWLETYVRFEILLLSELGFALDLEHCAVTGETADLAYVSPRTGRAVSRAAAGALAPRLLPLPGFLTSGGEADDPAIAQGLQLAGHFLSRHILGPMDKAMPAGRERLLARLAPETPETGEEQS